MKITKVKQHYIDFGESSLEEFVAEYRATPLRSLRKAMIESVNMQTNSEWLEARHGHITASNMSKFLSGGRSKAEVFGDTAKGIVNQYLDEKTDHCFDDMATRQETYFMKAGLIFEKRALELFTQATGFNTTDEIGFISDKFCGIDFGCSPDALVLSDDGKIDAIVEIKCRTGAEFRAERDKLGNKATTQQMQLAMLLADCPRAYLCLYDIANDRVQYIRWTRGMAFKRHLLSQCDEALAYIARENARDKVINLEETINDIKVDASYTD